MSWVLSIPIRPIDEQTEWPSIVNVVREDADEQRFYIPNVAGKRCSDVEDAATELMWWIGHEIARGLVSTNTHDRDKLLALADAVREFRAESATREIGVTNAEASE